LGFTWQIIREHWFTSFNFLVDFGQEGFITLGNWFPGSIGRFDDGFPETFGPI